MLVPGAVFLINIEHPVCTAWAQQGWAYGSDGQPLYWPVDGRFRPRRRKTQFLACPVEKQHHTLTQLLKAGCALKHMEQAQPPEEMLPLPGWTDALRRPMMLLIRAPDLKRNLTWRHPLRVRSFCVRHPV